MHPFAVSGKLSALDPLTLDSESACGVVCGGALRY